MNSYDANALILLDKILCDGKNLLFFKSLDIKSFSFGEKFFGSRFDLIINWKSFNVDKLSAEINFMSEIVVFVGM